MILTPCGMQKTIETQIKSLIAERETSKAITELRRVDRYGTTKDRASIDGQLYSTANGQQNADALAELRKAGGLGITKARVGSGVLERQLKASRDDVQSLVAELRQKGDFPRQAHQTRNEQRATTRR
jgi:hypothetical protein